MVCFLLSQNQLINAMDLEQRFSDQKHQTQYSPLLNHFIQLFN